MAGTANDIERYCSDCGKWDSQLNEYNQCPVCKKKYPVHELPNKGVSLMKKLWRRVSWNS